MSLWIRSVFITNPALFFPMTIILKLSTFVSACLFVRKTKLVLMQNPRLETLRLRILRVKQKFFGKKNCPRSRLMWEVLRPILLRCCILLYIAPLWRRYVHGRTKRLTLISYSGALEQCNWWGSRSIREHYILLFRFLVLQVRFIPPRPFLSISDRVIYSWDTVSNWFRPSTRGNLKLSIRFHSSEPSILWCHCIPLWNLRRSLTTI